MNKKMMRFQRDKILQWVLCIYLCLMFGVYPLITVRGYSFIPDDKYVFYKICNGLLLVAVFAILIIRLMQDIRGRKLPDLTTVRKHRWILAYQVVVLISACNSIDPEKGWHGYYEWYMGAFLLTDLIFLYLLFAEGWCDCPVPDRAGMHGKKKKGRKRWFQSTEELVIHMLIYAAGLVCLFGFFQRCGINLLPIYDFEVGDGFLSTMGNINWICGYLAIVYPILSYVYCVEIDSSKRIPESATVWIVSAFLAIQGSLSGWIVLGMTWVCFFVRAFLKPKKDIVLRYITYMMLCMAGMVCASGCYRIAGALGVKQYAGMSGILYSSIWPIGFLLSLLACFFVSRKKCSVNVRKCRVFCHSCIGLMITCLIGIVILMIGYQCNPEFFSWVGNYKMLVFDNAWGTGRAAEWKIGISAWLNGSVWEKLFGYGPDCFAAATELNGAVTFPDAAYFLRDSLTITNAHNEWITVLVNTGILGFVTYVGWLFTLCRRMWKEWKEGQEKAFAGVAIILVVTVHNMVSFQQILATPFFFILLGLTSNSRCVVSDSAKESF